VDFEEYVPLTAAGGGHSRADWGNWAKRQLRDQNGDDAGEWIEMGRSSRFRYQKADGSIGTGDAVYVGFSDKPNHGRFYVKGVDGVQEGVYDLDAGSVDPVKFYFAEGTKVGDYLENYYKSIGRNLDDLGVPSKLPVIDFSALTPSQLTEEEANEIKTENRMPPPRNLDEELKSRTEKAKRTSDLVVGDIVYDEALNRYGSVEDVESIREFPNSVSNLIVRWSNNQVQELKRLDGNKKLKVWSKSKADSRVVPYYYDPRFGAQTSERNNNDYWEWIENASKNGTIEPDVLAKAIERLGIEVIQDQIAAQGKDENGRSIRSNILQDNVRNYLKKNPEATLEEALEKGAGIDATAALIRYQKLFDNLGSDASDSFRKMRDSAQEELEDLATQYYNKAKKDQGEGKLDSKLPYPIIDIKEEYDRVAEEDVEKAAILAPGEAAGPEITPDLDDVRSGFLARYFDDNAELVDSIEGNDIKHLLMATMLEIDAKSGNNSKADKRDDTAIMREWYEKVFESLAAEDPEFKKNYPTWESRSKLLHDLSIHSLFLVRGGETDEKDGKELINWDGYFTDEQRAMQKRVNRRFAELILKLNPDGKIKIYRNANALTYRYKSIEQAHAGYWSFDRDFAYSFNSNDSQKLTQFEGRHSAFIAVSDIIGLIAIGKRAGAGDIDGYNQGPGIYVDEMHLSISPQEAVSGVLQDAEFNGLARDVVLARGVGDVRREPSRGGGDTQFRVYGNVPAVAIQAVPADNSILDKLREFLSPQDFSYMKDYYIRTNVDSTIEINLGILNNPAMLKALSEFQKATNNVLLVNNYNRSREAVDLENETLYGPVDQNIVSLSREELELYASLPSVEIPEGVELTPQEQKEFDSEKEFATSLYENRKEETVGPALSAGYRAQSFATLVDSVRKKQQKIVNEATKRKIAADKEVEDEAAEYRRQQIEEAKSAVENGKKYLEQLRSEGDLEGASYMEETLLDYEARVKEVEAGYDRYRNPGHKPVSDRVQTLLNIIETYDADGSIRKLVLNGGSQEEIKKAIEESSAYKEIEEAQRQYEAVLEEYNKTAEAVEYDEDDWSTPSDPNRPQGPDITNWYVDEFISESFNQDNRLTPEENAAQRKEALESFKTKDSQPASPAEAQQQEQQPTAAPLDFSNFEKVSGPLGSNPGGIYKDPATGKQYYVKIQDKKRGDNEQLASALYREAGLDSLEVKSGTLDGNNVTYTDWRDEKLESVSKKISSTTPPAPNDPAFDGFAIDAWLANWDVVGTGYDNLSFDKDGNPVRLDAGGALLYRARGGRKGGAFDNEVGELQTFKNPSNTTGELFRHMGPEAEARSADRLRAITPERIDELVDQFVSDPADNQELKDKLKARRDFILNKYPAATPAESQEEAAPTSEAVQEEPAAEPAQELKDEISGDEALQTIRSAIAKDLEAQGRFPIIRSAKDIEDTVSKQYKSFFEQIKRENPELLKGVYYYTDENGNLKPRQDIETPEQFWDHIRGYATDIGTQWNDPEKIENLIKRVNTLYAEKFLGVKPGGLISFYRNNIRRTNDEAKAAAGYASLDRYMAFDYNVGRGIEDGGPNIGRYEIKARPDEVTGLLGFSRIADEIGVVISDKVTAIPGRVKRLGDLEIPNPENASWFDLANLKSADGKYDRSTGASPFRQNKPLGQFEYYALDSSPFGEGSNWAAFYEANGLQEGAIPGKYDELFGEGAWERDWGRETPRSYNYEPLFKEFKDKDGKIKWGLQAQWLHTIGGGADKYFNDPKAGDEYDRAIKVLSVMQELMGKTFFVPRGQQQEDSGPIVDAKKKRTTKPASELAPGDQITVDGETKNVTEVEKTLKVWATTELGKEVEIFYEYDEDLKNSLDENEDGDLQFEDEDYGLITVETYLPITRVTTKEDEDPLEFTAEEKVNFISTGTEDTAGVAPKPTKTDLEKQKYEDALANGAKRSPISLKYGDVVRRDDGAEFIVISVATKADRDKNNKRVLRATFQAPDGKVVALNLNPDELYRVLVQKSKKADEKDPYKLENVYRKPNVEGKPNQGSTEDEDEDGDEESTNVDGKKAVEDLKVNDIVVVDGKTYRFVAADENEDGTVQLVLKDSKGREFIPEASYKYEDIVETAAKMRRKSKAKTAADPTISVPGAKGLPGSKGSFVKSEDGKRRVTYEVLSNGRVLMIFGFPGIATNSPTHITLQNAVAKMPSTLGKFTPPFFYNGDGTKKSADGEGRQAFLSEDETRKNWVIELNPGESESTQILIENLINAIQKEFDEAPAVQTAQASKDEPITGKVNTAGILSDSPRVTYSVQNNGKISIVGNVPEGYEKLADHLFDLYPEENVILDPDSGEIEVFAQSGQDINTLRSEVLAAIKKYVAGDSAEEEVVVVVKKVVEEDRQKTYDIMQAAFEFYAKQMAAKDNKGVKYLESRGYSRKAIEELGIIFAGDSSFSLSAHLTSLGFTVDEILATGLVNRYEDRLLDSFSNRVLFPFKDSKGRVVGFNGRDISGKKGAPKYILTSGPNETNKSVFNKSEVLYNLENTLDAVKETGQLILVEGQVDVLAYREAGINNVVAISGTSISPKQIELLQDTFGDDLKEIILSLDSDEPGKKATKGVYQTLADSGYGYEISTVTIPQGFKDPGELFEDKSQGTDSLKYIIQERRDAAIPEEDLATDEQFQEYVRLMEKYRADMDETTTQYFLKAFDKNATKKIADGIINSLFEQYELPKLQAELDDVIEKAIAAKVISADYKLEIDYDVKTSTNKKETIQQAVESLKKKIEAATPAVAKANLTQNQRDYINRQFSSGVVTQEQRNALVAILEKPDLTKDEIERVVRTLDLAETIWRINNGWTLDDSRGVNMTPPIIDLGVTPIQVVQRIKTYKPTKDINGNPLPQQPAAEDKKPAAEPTPEKPAAEKPTTEEVTKEKPAAAPKPSNLGAQTGTPSLPQTMDNFNADGRPAYAPKGGAFRGAALQARIAQAYKTGGVQGIKDFLANSNVTPFDIESTGMSSYDGQLKPGNRIVQLGASKKGANGEQIFFNQFIRQEDGVVMSDWSAKNLERPVLDENGNPTGEFVKIDKEWLDQQKSEKEVLEEFIKFIGADAILLAHNANFDISVLEEALDRNGLSLDVLGAIDTLDFVNTALPKFNADDSKGKPVELDAPKRQKDEIKSEDVDPSNPAHFRTSAKLDDVLKFFGLEPTGWHRADADAYDASRILDNILDWLIKNPERESTNALGHRFLDFDKIAEQADKDLISYLKAIGSATPATDKQKSLNPKTNPGYKPEGFAPDLRKLEVPEEKIKEIIAPVQNMTRGQAEEYIASILSDVRSGKDPDIKKALEKSKATFVPARSSNTVPNGEPQNGGLREFEVSKRAKDLSIGDRIRAKDSDVYGTIKSIDRKNAGFVKLSVDYEDGSSETLTVKLNALVAVYEEEKPSEVAINDSNEQPGQAATPAAEEPGDQPPAVTPTPTPTPAPVTPEQQPSDQLSVDLSDYSPGERARIRELLENINELQKLSQAGEPIQILESGNPVTTEKDTDDLINILTSKTDMYDLMVHYGVSKTKARIMSNKLEKLKGEPNYFEELKKVNEYFNDHMRNRKSFSDIEKDRGFRTYLVDRGLIPSVKESYEFILSNDPKIAAIRSRERDLYYAWSQSLKKRGKTKTIREGNVSLTYSADETLKAPGLLRAAVKLQKELPLDGRKLRVSIYSPEQLELLNQGTIVGASLVTDKLGHIGISSSIVGRQEKDPREGADGQIDSDTYTLAHEYGHVYDEVALGGQARKDFIEEFKDSELTIYAEENMSENFAEHMADLGYSILTGTEPASQEFKNFIEKAKEDGRIDPLRLDKKGPFFGEGGIQPRRIVAKVGNQEIPELLEKTEEELKQFESATNIGNSNWGAWLRETDEAAGYLLNLSNDKVAKKYSSVVGISSDDFENLSPEEQAIVLDQVRNRLNPIIEAQKKDSRTYRVFEVAGTNIHIRTKDGSVSPETLSSVVNELQELNRFNDMGGMPVIVTLAENNTFTMGGVFLTDRDEGFNVLNYDKTQMHIVLNAAQDNGKGEYKANPRDNYKGPTPKTGILNTLIHEYLGHGLAKVFLGQDIDGRGKHHERFKEFESKFPLYSSNDKHPVSVYGNESTKESFAEFVRASYLLSRNGDIELINKQPEILRFLQYLDPLVTTLDPILNTNQTGSDLANVDKMESPSPRFPRASKGRDANSDLYTYGRRSAFYSNGLDPYGLPVDADFDEVLFMAYTLAEGTRARYLKNPSSENFYRYAAYASTVNDLYNAKFFSYPKNNPRQTVDTIFDSIITSTEPGSFRRWQTDKPFVPLRYASSDSKFNNNFVVGSYTDASGNTYQIAYVSSEPSTPADDVSESAYVFVSKPNQTLGDFVGFDSTLNDLIKNSAGQLKIRNHIAGGTLDRGELEIQGTKVDGAYRRRGLATAMLAFAKQNSTKYLRFGTEQTVQEDAWARSVDQNPKNHLGLPAFTNSESGLNPSNVSPIADPALVAGQTSQSFGERTRINFNPDNRDSVEEDLIAQVASEYLNNPVFNGSKDYSSSTGGGLGPNNSVVGAVSVETLSSIAGNEVNEDRVQELIEKINANKGFSDPVVVYYNPKTGQSVVADGNHHVEAAKRIGLTHIPTRVITGEFESSEYLSPKVVGKEWSRSNVPFSSKEWPMHVNPYFVFNNDDLVTRLEDAPIVDPLRDRVVLKSGVEGLSPDMDEISKLMGRLVKDSVTGQIYQVLDEYQEKDGTPTGKVIVVRFAGIADDPDMDAVRETQLIDGRFNFDASGKIYLTSGSISINDEDPYNDLRQYEAELRSIEDLEDVTESFVKSGGQSFIVAESMFFVWTKGGKKGRISKFTSPGVVELAVLTNIDKDGNKSYDFYEVPVADLVPIQNQRETIGSEPAYLSNDMKPNPTTVNKITSLLSSLYSKGFLSTEFYTSMSTAVAGKFQTNSGIEDMYKSLLKLSQRRRSILEDSGKLEKMVLTKNVRAQLGPAAESTDSAPATTTPATPATPVTPAAPASPPPAERPIVKGRMSFRQLYEENKNRNGVPSVDRKVNGPTPIPDSQNPISKPSIEEVREIIDILSEISGYNNSYISDEERDIILNSLAMATAGTASDYLESLRAKRLKKRIENNEPITGINVPQGLKQEAKDNLENYTPNSNLDGSSYGEQTEIIDDDEETRDLISFIDTGLLSGSLLLVTGGAGTGKSTVLRRMISELEPRKNIISVASTGVAAHNVGEGKSATIHSVFRINPNVIVAEGFTQEDPENPGQQISTLDFFIRELRKDTKRLRLFRDADILTIDEISMVDANIMELIDLSLRVARNNQKPFGGVKVVAFGDDNQLPPVEAWSPSKQAKLEAKLKEIDDLSFADKNEQETENKKSALIKASKFDRDKHNYMMSEYGGYRWYKSNVLGVSNPLAYMLTKNRRQEKDKPYAGALQKIPKGQVTASELAYFNESNVEVPKEILDRGIIRLVLTNERARSINEVEVRKLQQSGALGIEFEGTFTGEGKSAFTEDNLHVPEKITYYVGEKVIFVLNDTADLRREAGFAGKTNRWTNGTQGTVVDFDEDDGLPIVEIVSEDGTKNRVKVGYGKSTAKGAEGYTQIDELTGKVVEKSGIGVLAEYTQIPMLPAYAMTIHKSQGLSIERAIVDLQNADGTDGKAFAAGQLYVALSRLTSKNGLFLTRKLDYKDFLVDEDNERYYENLVKITQESLKAEAEAAKAPEGPTVDKKVSSTDKILFKNVTKADVKTAKKILEHRARPIPNLPSDWGTRDLSDYFFSQFGYGEESSFKQNLDAIMSEKVENLHSEQKLLVSLIVAHGKADIYEHAETGTTIKRHLEDGLFSNKNASDADVLRAAAAHKRIIDSGHFIGGGAMDIHLKDLSYIMKKAAGMFSPDQNQIDLDINQVYKLAFKNVRNRVSEEDKLTYVLAHEYGHLLDNTFSENGERLSVVLENLIKSGMQNRAKEMLDGYALSSLSEYFAESYAGLVLQPVLSQLGYSDRVFMDEALVDEIKNRINVRNSE
jgi:DNA primase catalytic core